MKRSKNQIGLLAVLLAAVLTGATSLVYAQGATSLPRNEAASSTLAGNAGGSFDMYQIAYPGGGQTLTVQVKYSPADYVTGQAFGFNVYGPNGFSGKGQPTGDGQPGVKTFDYASNSATTLDVQVYNYGSRPVSYTIQSSGITEVAAKNQPTATPTEVPLSPTDTGRTTITGSSFGNTGGAIQLYRFYYPGDGQSLTITMHLAPADPTFAGWFNFQVYAPNGALVAKGGLTDAAGVRVAAFSSDMAGTYTLQVYNYARFTTMTYTIDFSR